MVTIPVSAFYAREPVTNVVRFAFCKQDSVLDQAVGQIADWRRGLND